MKAVINVVHTGCADAITMMLRSVGYDVWHLSDEGMDWLFDLYKVTPGIKLKKAALMGYDKPLAPFTGVKDIKDWDLFVGVKEKELDQMRVAFPKLKLLLFTINGGKGVYTKSKYPVVSANFATPGFKCYLPFVNRYGLKPRETESYTPPVCLVHNLDGWGYGSFTKDLQKLGVKFYGDYGAPDGVIYHGNIFKVLQNAKAMVHMKGIDAPGYALYEAFASGVPIILPHLFIDRTGFKDLFIPGETCLSFGKYAYEIKEDTDHPKETWKDPETHQKVVSEINILLEQLSDPKENKRIGLAGHKKWKELTAWTEEKAEAFEKYLCEAL